MSLIKMMNGEYVLINDKHTRYFSSVDKLIESKHNIPSEELELALTSLIQNSHNAAYFGILNRTFIYTEKL